MIKTTQPALHGDQHLPDGSDPIPLGPTPTGGFVDQILANPHLLHYWRMGAASGNQPDLVSPPFDLQYSHSTGYVLGTYDVTGALDPTEDDGAWQSNTGGNTAGDHFATTTGHRAAFTGTNPFTILCWARRNSAWTHVGDSGGLVSIRTGGGTSNGVTLAQLQDGRLILIRTTTGTYTTLGVTADAWHFIVATYDGTTSRIYVDGSLFFSQANAATVMNTTTVPIWVGRAPATTPDEIFYGRIDEVALFDVALTAGEITDLYTLGISGSVGTDGLVWTSDADGNPTWEDPTIKVDGTRYQEILSGTALDATDNTDGSVTLGLAATVAGAGLTETSDVLSVNVDASTIEINSDTLRVKADGITGNEIAANAVGSSELASTTVTPGAYGDATHVATFIVDADGRLTAAGTATISSSGGGTSQHILLADGHGTPFTFNDMLQMDDGSDFMWNDPE